MATIYRQGQKTGRSGGGTTSLLLIAVVMLFIIVVTYGWLHLLKDVVGNLIAASALALLLTVIALLVARYIGERRSAAQATGQGSRERAIDWILIYPFLFLISALGTMNTAFYRFEGASVLQTDIDRAQTKLRQLVAAAELTFGGTEHQAKVQRVNSELVVLRREMTERRRKSNLCGIGTEAQKNIDAILADLPRFRVPHGVAGQNNCDTVDQEASYAGVDTLAHQLLDEEVSPTLKSVEDKVRTSEAALLNAEKGFDVSAGGNISDDTYRKAQEALRIAATTYSEGRELVVAASSPKSIPGSIVDERLEFPNSLQLGSVFNLIPTILSRLSYGSTWVYICSAILLDLALVFLFMQAALGGQKILGREAVPSTDPKFLWVNPDDD